MFTSDFLVFTAVYISFFLFTLNFTKLGVYTFVYYFCVINNFLTFFNDLIMKTKTMSVRLPVNMVDEIKETCLTKGITTSDFIKEKVISSNNLSTDLSTQNDVKIDAQTQEILLGFAGSGILGLSVYKGVHYALDNSDKELDDKEKKMYSTICAIVCALLSFFIISKYFSKKE